MVTDDDEDFKIDYERIQEIIADEEIYDALSVLHDKNLSPDEIYQASFYLALSESGERD